MPKLRNMNQAWNKDPTAPDGWKMMTQKQSSPPRLEGPTFQNRMDLTPHMTTQNYSKEESAAIRDTLPVGGGVENEPLSDHQWDSPGVKTEVKTGIQMETQETKLDKTSGIPDPNALHDALECSNTTVEATALYSLAPSNLGLAHIPPTPVTTMQGETASTP